MASRYTFLFGFRSPGYSSVELDAIHKHLNRKESIRKIFKNLSS